MTPGSRRRLLAVACVVVAVVAASAGWILTRGGDRASAASGYGRLPSWLPKARVPVGRVLVASSDHPRLTIQGDSVSVHLSHGRVLATTVGPDVPETGKFPVPPTSPCRFTVTLTAATGTVPVRASAITILDELGHVHHPRVTALDGGSPPAVVPPGRTVTLEVRDVLPTGGGRLRWAPEGTTAIASWDFDVEID